MIEYHPLRVKNQRTGQNKPGAIKVKIGDVELGTPPQLTLLGEGVGSIQPNPIKISWSRTNDVAVHKIPYPKYKTCRTSKESLYTLQINFKTLLYQEYFVPVLRLCENCGPHWVKTATKEMWMYITDYSYEQTQGFDDDYIDWNLTLVETND
jgi:hypothetical protein